MLAKFALTWIVARLFRTPAEPAERLALALAQGGEFAFVLFRTDQNTGCAQNGTSLHARTDLLSWQVLRLPTQRESVLIEFVHPSSLSPR